MNLKISCSLRRTLEFICILILNIAILGLIVFFIYKNGVGKDIQNITLFTLFVSLFFGIGAFFAIFYYRDKAMRRSLTLLESHQFLEFMQKCNKQKIKISFNLDGEENYIKIEK